MRAVDAFYYANDMLKIIGFFYGVIVISRNPKTKT